ncbi:MAG: two-component regulator propeller domain-containing protein [Treponemataceae bacterium]
MRKSDHHRVVFCLFFLLFPVLEPASQEARFSRLSRQDGLSNSSVSSIVQDSRGFLWFGTKNGLNRYDGYDFIVYSNDPFKADSLSHNQVQTLYMDARDILWIGTRQGLSRFDTGTKKFTRFLHNPKVASSLSNDSVTAVYRDSFGRLWVGTMDGLNALDESSGRFTSYSAAEDSREGASRNGIVGTILQTRDGVLWVGGSGGLLRYDRETNSFAKFIGNFPSDKITALSEDTSGNLWAGCWGGGLVRIDKDRKTTRVWSFPDNRLNSLVTAFDGVVYAGTSGGGLVELDLKKNSFIVHRADASRPYALAVDDVDSLFMDESGLLWVGTDGGGVYKLDGNRDRFDKIVHDPLVPGSLSKGAVLAALQDSRGSLWVGTDNGGLNRMDPNSASFRHYRSRPKNPRSLSNDTVNDIMEDSGGSIWVATDEGLNRFDAGTDSFERLTGTDAPCNAIATDSDGRHWYGFSRDGVERYDPKTGERLRFPADPNDPKSLSDNQVYFIEKDSRGDIWIGTNGGLNRFDPNTGGFIRFTRKQADRSSLTGDSVRCMLEDSKGRLWFGMAGNGISLFDQKTGKFEHFFKKAGLPDDSVLSILEDESGKLWLGTNFGLCVFDPEYKDIRVLESEDGRQGPEFTSAAFRNTAGGLYFGGADGLTRVTRASPGRKTYKSPVRLTAIKVFDRELVSGNEIADTREVRLSHQENFISIEFAVLDYRDPKTNRYAYKLEGFDKDWIASGARRRASYANLSGGQYVFRVKASNNNGVWNEDGVRLRVSVTPTFWITPAAFVLYFAVAFFFVAAVFAWVSRDQRLRLSVAELSERRRISGELKVAKDRAEAADKAKSEFLANLSHEIRTPMNAVLGYASILAEKMTDDPRRSLVEVIDRSGRSLLSLLNDALDLSRMDAGKAPRHSAPLRIRSLVSDLLEMFRLRSEEKGVSLRSIIDPSVPCVILGDETKLRQILVNLIGNAIKFTDKGSVTVSLSSEAEVGPPEPAGLPSLVIQVVDTGIGLNEEAVHRVFEPFYQQEHVNERYGGTGLGLTIVQRLTEDLGGQIAVTSEVGKGSGFTVRIPDLRAATAADGAVSSLSDAVPDDRRLDGTDLLIVEDDPVNRDLMGRMLESRGAAVRTALNGEEGLRSIEIRIPDAVLTDLRMPKVDGFAFLEALRNHPSTKNLPVLIVTADLRSETRSRLAGYGSATIVPKPVERSHLLDCLETVLPGRVVRASEPVRVVPLPALTRETLQTELGAEKATQAVAALSGAALTARKSISAALIVDEWNEFVAALEIAFVQFGSREIGRYASRTRAALSSFDVEELARLRVEFDVLVRDAADV